MKDFIKDFMNVLKIEEDGGYRCSRCRDTGYVIHGDTASVCGCKPKNAHIPGRLDQLYLKDFDLKYYPQEMIHPETSRDTYREKASTLLEAAVNFVHEVVSLAPGVKGLFITGPIGSGKTQLVSGICNELRAGGVEVRFFVVPELLEQAKAEMFDDGSKKDVFSLAKKAQVLVLDDLGAHNYTPWIVNSLFNLINYRLNEELTTIITTNLSLEEIDTRLDERIASRILELCNSYELDVDADIRYKKNILKQ